MRNCLVAQSGGPTAVINSSFIGVLDEVLNNTYFDNIYAGINGIEGILNENLVNLSQIPYNKLEGLKYTPVSFSQSEGNLEDIFMKVTEKAAEA
jgi:6-phosphofructokinase 1